MPYDPSVTIAQAESSLDQMNARRRQANGRVYPKPLKQVEAAKLQKIHVFSVGPWAKVMDTGSTGTFFMPACPFDKPYVELLRPSRHDPKVMEPPIDAIMEEFYPGEGKWESLADDGREFALAMLGIGRGNHPSNALTHFGLFVADGDKPTKQELADARAALEVTCLRLCKEADTVYSTDRKLASRVILPEVHFVAAKVVGRDNPVDSPWMLAAAPEGRKKCKVCGRVVDPDVAMCEGGHIVN